MIRIDTLKLAHDLAAAGMPTGEAEAVARAMGDATGSIDISDLATKADIADLKADIADLRSEMLRLILLQAGLIVGAIAAIATLFKLFTP